MYYNCDQPVSSIKNIFGNNTYDIATLYVPAAAMEKIKETEPWKNFAAIEEYDFSGVEEVESDIDPSQPCEIYTLAGVPVGASIEALVPGVYIIRQGNKVEKVAVK